MIGSGGPYALHHPQFRVDDRALFPTAHYLSQLAVQALRTLSAEKDKAHESTSRNRLAGH
jgi:hypothetical protein